MQKIGAVTWRTQKVANRGWWRHYEYGHISEAKKLKRKSTEEIPSEIRKPTATRSRQYAANRQVTTVNSETQSKTDNSQTTHSKPPLNHLVNNVLVKLLNPQLEFTYKNKVYVPEKINK